MALSGTTLDELVKPELRDEWSNIKDQWFPRTDTAEHAAYDKRTPGTRHCICLEILLSMTVL